MSNANVTKSTARLEARITPEIKALLQKAADLQGRSLTDFIVSTVQSEAQRVIEQHQILKLASQDSEAFAKALLNSLEPNEALKAAALRHRQVMG